MNVLECNAVSKRFAVGRHSVLHAVDEVNLSIARGESVGLVGESGCGKSTLARMITRITDPTSGSIVYNGTDIGRMPARRFATTPYRAKIQMVFQDPTDSLNPRHTAFDTIAEPFRRLTGVRNSELVSKVTEAAQKVGLPPELLHRYPHQLSGGQKARVGIARAISVAPDLLVLDEPTAALDVSVQATILKLLDRLKRDLGMSYLFVSHDLNVVRMLCSRVVVMYLGKVVEEGPTESLFRKPAHPYTAALIAAIPSISKRERSSQLLPGEPRSPINPAPQVCRFVGRCPAEQRHCSVEAPTLREVRPSHFASCHFVSTDFPVSIKQ